MQGATALLDGVAAGGLVAGMITELVGIDGMTLRIEVDRIDVQRLVEIPDEVDEDEQCLPLTERERRCRRGFRMLELRDCRVDGVDNVVIAGSDEGSVVILKRRNIREVVLLVAVLVTFRRTALIPVVADVGLEVRRLSSEDRALLVSRIVLVDKRGIDLLRRVEN